MCQVPFVDVINTMLDPSIPLTVAEYEEWGDPNDKVFFEYMLSYSPYDNVEAKDYPNLLSDLAEYNSMILKEIEEQLSILNDEETHDAILYSLEIFQQYLVMTTNPKFESYLNQTEYIPAVNSMVYILVCLSVYIHLFKQEQENEKIMNLLNKKLSKHTKELEEYVETAEIEFDSEQMNIFKKTKMFK